MDSRGASVSGRFPVIAGIVRRFRGAGCKGPGDFSGEGRPFRVEARVEDSAHGLENGDPDAEPAGSDYPLAALVMPATLDHIRAISEHCERMPAKSTYFYPKLLSGLVINPLDKD